MHMLVLIGMNKFCKKNVPIYMSFSIVNTTLTIILSILLLLFRLGLMSVLVPVFSKKLDGFQCAANHN
jgi:hypothetical protein